MADTSLPSLSINKEQAISLQIPVSDVPPSLRANMENTMSLNIPLSDGVPSMQSFLTNPSIWNITDIPPTVVVPPPTPGTGANFQLGWWLYVNSGPFVPNNTNFGEGWFMYANSR